MTGEVTIRPARREELEEIWAMVGRAVAHMNQLGNPQWGEDYPTRDFYAGDIDRGELYAAVMDGKLAGVACINTAESPEYDPLPWTTSRPAMVIHRMAIDPALQEWAPPSSPLPKRRPAAGALPPCASTPIPSMTGCRP